MMNVPPHSCNELSYLPPNPPPPTLPIMDQERPEQLGYNLLEANGNMSISNPLALLPSNTSLQHHTQAAHHDILQIYPTSSSHYLSNPYGTHFPGPGSTSFQYSYYPSVPTAPEYHLPSLVAPPAAEDNMASTQLGLNLGYRTYFPPRGGYAYGHHLPRCQAEGCKADLSSAKRYHRRHRVCAHHSKAPLVVTAGGLHQRFCQQCSRFHLLDEFDDTKKSCRKRLADHNRRRRKSKPSDVDAATDKKRTQASKATTKEAGSSGKSTTIGAAVEQQVVASAHLRKEQHHQTTSLGVQVVGDHKWKASMQQAAPHASLYHRNHHGFSFPSSSGTCFPQSQVVSSDNTSTIAQEHEPSLAFHQLHNHRNVLQLGQAMFDLDFTN